MIAYYTKVVNSTKDMVSLNFSFPIFKEVLISTLYTNFLGQDQIWPVDIRNKAIPLLDLNNSSHLGK